MHSVKVGNRFVSTHSSHHTEVRLGMGLEKRDYEMSVFGKLIIGQLPAPAEKPLYYRYGWNYSTIGVSPILWVSADPYYFPVLSTAPPHDWEYKPSRWSSWEYSMVPDNWHHIIRKFNETLLGLDGTSSFWSVKKYREDQYRLLRKTKEEDIQGARYRQDLSIGPQTLIVGRSKICSAYIILETRSAMISSKFYTPDGRWVSPEIEYLAREAIQTNNEKLIDG